MKTTTRKPLRLCVVAACLATGASLSHALDLAPDAVALQAGAGTHGTRMAGAGLVWDWDFERMRRKAELTAHTELMLNSWRADAIGGGEHSYTQVVLLPSLRMRLSRGASPWYIELGIGASYMDKLFATPDKQFSTRWNFYDMMGVGHTLGGPDGTHEVGLRWVHVSNAGLKKPNPGQDFLQLRYVARF
jgi:lipid A 3-O-deacylase